MSDVYYLFKGEELVAPLTFLRLFILISPFAGTAVDSSLLVFLGTYPLTAPFFPQFLTIKGASPSEH